MPLGAWVVRASLPATAHVTTLRAVDAGRQLTGSAPEISIGAAQNWHLKVSQSVLTVRWHGWWKDPSTVCKTCLATDVIAIGIRYRRTTVL